VAASGAVAYNNPPPGHDRPGGQEEPGEVEVGTWDAIRARRNGRSYAGRAIAPQDLDRVLEAGRRAPLAGNQQAWDFVVCTDREQLAQLAGVWRGARHVPGSAAAIALVAPASEDARMRDLIQLTRGAGGAETPRRPQSEEVAPLPGGWRPALAVAAVPRLAGFGLVGSPGILPTRRRPPGGEFAGVP
jgi:hypothetical protein